MNAGTLLNTTTTIVVYHCIERLIVVKVDAGRAEAHIASVLLDVGSRPAAEGVPIIERRIVVVVGVPQRQVAELSSVAHDGRPLAVTGVDA